MSLNKPSFFKLMCFVAVFMLSGMGYLSAQSVIYSFTSSTSGSYASLGSNMSASALSRVNGATAPSSPCDSGFSSTSFSSTTTYASSLAAIQWSITPASGYNVIINSFTAGIRRSGTGPAYARFAYSTDNGANWKDKGTNDAPNNAGCGSMATASFTGLSFKSTGIVLFRIYVFGASSGAGTFQLLNVGVTGTVALAGFPNDASVSNIRFPAGSICEGTQNVMVDLSNPGINDLKNATIQWTINGVKQPDYAYSKTLTPGTKDSGIILGSYTFEAGTDTIKVWATNPNGTTDGNKLNDSFSRISVVNQLPGALVGDSATICAGDSVYLGDSAVNGSIYIWNSSPSGFSSSLSAPVVKPVITTMYYLTEINISGCQLMDSVLIRVNPIPTPDAGKDTTICEGDSVVLGGKATTGSTYTWVNLKGDTLATIINPVVAPKTTTTYFLKETNTNGCHAIDSVLISVNPAPIAIAGNDSAICYGNLILIGGATDSTNTYAWTSVPAGYVSTNATNLIMPTATASYHLLVTSDKGCHKSSTVTVTVNPLPVIKAGKDSVLCYGSSVSVGVANISANVYNWTSVPAGDSSTKPTPVFKPLVSTKYLVTATNVYGCKAKDSVAMTVVALPTPDAGKDSAICQGGSINIGANDSTVNTYTWTSVPAGYSSTKANPVINPLATATYFVEAVNATGCKSNDSVNVTVVNLPKPDAGKDTAICTGSSLTIGNAGENNVTYVWTSSPAGFASTTSSASVNPTAKTVYHVEAKNTLGCAVKDSVIVSVNANPVAGVTAADTTICIGESIAISATTGTGLKYTWMRNGKLIADATNATYSSNDSGAYSVKVVNASGCSAISRNVTVIEYPLPAKPAITQAGSVLSSSGAANNQWYKSGVKIAGATAQTFTPTLQGTYSVEVTSAQGCSNMSDEFNYINTGIKENAVATFEIYPNPASANISIRFAGLEQSKVTLQLTDMNGKLIVKQQFSTSSTGDINLDLKAAGIGQGFYILTLQSGAMMMQKPLVVLP